MKKHLFVYFILGACFSVKAQSASDAAVILNASVQNSPPQITLNWTGNASTTQYQVFRKLKSATSWGAVLASLSGTVNQYVDNTVSAGTNYEYRVIRFGSGYNGFGYINTGINISETEYRGKLILVVDSTFIAPLAVELKRLVKDVEGDGWDVVRHDVERGGSVYHVKELIVNDYHLDSINTKAVFVVGHVPVPYSGNINPDGHPDHLGAWPADVYYGDMDGIWTDVSVNSTTASPARTQNVPGDGKFDQSLVPGNVELQVGRADFANLPTFTLTEQQLLKNYLDKDHDYRKKIFTPIKQGVIDDNFGYFSGEAFAASGFKNLGPLVGTANITSADYFTSMGSASYQWSYGCGGGTYVSAGGVGNTTNFSTSNLQGVFTMLFGSYFGDWDCQNNFLRAPLAQGKILTNVWSGRPHYQFHHMGLGENIGYSLLTTQNNPGSLYYASPTGITGKWIHNALMGDPTLRNDIVAPVTNVVATKNGYNCDITWTASTETTVIGYHLYMRNDSNMTYQRVNSAPITGTSYTDSCLAVKGIYEYMVRAIKLETSFLGTYYNMSEGISDTAYNSQDFLSLAGFTSTLNAATVWFTNTSTIPAAYQWSFGDGQTATSANPNVTYATNGTYTVQLIASHPCYIDTSTSIINITEVGIDELVFENAIAVHPNPSKGVITVTGKIPLNSRVIVYSYDGKIVFEKENCSNNESLDLGFLQKGMYLISIESPEKKLTGKLVLE